MTKDASTVSSDKPAKRLQMLIRTIAGATPKGKELTIRSFVHTADEHALMDEALSGLDDLPAGIHIAIMIKATSTDWLTYFPYQADFNPWVNTSFTHRSNWDVIMECDLGFEFLGQNQFPYAQVEYVQGLVRHAIAMNASGIVARIERSCLPSEAGGTCVVDQPATTILGTMNEVTLDALTAAVANASIPPSQVYIDFCNALVWCRCCAVHPTRIRA